MVYVAANEVSYRNVEFNHFLNLQFFLGSFKPFLDEKSIWQFAIISLDHLLIAYVYIVVMTGIATLFLNVGFYLEAFFLEYQQSFDELDVVIRKEGDRNTNEIKRSLIRIIKFHRKVVR